MADVPGTPADGHATTGLEIDEEHKEAMTLDEVISESFMMEAREWGDPLADGTVAALAKNGGPRNIAKLLADIAGRPYTDLLLDIIQLPACDERNALINYVNESGKLPYWADSELIRQAQEFFQDHSFMAYVVLGGACLPELYTCGNGGTQVLEVTHKLADRVAQRVHETAHIINDVMMPGGLDNSKSPGVMAVQKVRLMHAAVRYLALADDSADATKYSLADGDRVALAAKYQRDLQWRKKWGRPIGQQYMSGTLQTFSYVILRGFKDLGITYTARQQEAYVHCWNVVGHLMGVDDRFLTVVKTYNDSERLFWAVMNANISTTDDEKAVGAALTEALARYMEKLIDIHMAGVLRKWFDHATCKLIPRFTILRLIGSKRGAILGITLTGSDLFWFGVWNAMVNLGTQALVRSPFQRVLRSLLALDIYNDMCELDPNHCNRRLMPPRALMSLWHPLHVKDGGPH